MENEDYSPLFEDAINERFETFVTRPKDFFKKDIVLYRGVPGRKLDIITPTFLNNGTALSKPRASSFWSDDKLTAYRYTIRGGFNRAIKNEMSKEDIDYLNKLYDKLAETNNAINNGVHNLTKTYKDVLKDNANRPPIVGIRGANLIAYTDDYFTKDKVLLILNRIRLPEAYLYKITVHGWDKDLGIGRNKGVREFTLDRDVKPDSAEKVDRISPELIKSIEWYDDIKSFFDDIYNPADSTKLSKVEELIKTKGNRVFDAKSAYKTKFFRDEFINEINNNKEAILLADTHLGKNCSVEQAIKDADVLNKKIIDIANSTLKNSKKINFDYLLLLGDIVDKSKVGNFNDFCEIFLHLIQGLTRNLSKSFKVIYILGNSENLLKPLDVMECIYKRGTPPVAYVDYKIETDKYVFTHAPIDVPDGKINIHAHLHDSHKYWNADPEKCINVWLAADGPNPILLSDVLKYGADKDAFVLKDDPTGGKSNKIMTKLYKKTALTEEVINSEEIKISDVMNLISPIVYGFYSTKDGSRIDNREFIHNCDNLRSIYSVNWDPKKTLHDKLGICTDQSVVTRYLLNKFHPEIKVQLYALYKGRFGHCVCTFEDNGKYYYLEHAWDKEQGLHGPFNSEVELEDYLDFIYHKNHDKDNDDAVLVMKYNPSELTESYSIGLPDLK